MARRHHVDAVRLLENPDSRTTQSVLSTFQAHMHVVAALGDAWSSDAPGRFSIAQWLHNPAPFRPVILQHDPRYPSLSNIWIGGMLALLASSVGSPSLRESRERRIWIFADEFPQLPRLSNFSTFLDLGRSKGVIAVICAQDLAQLRATYGHERAEAWVGMIGTKIITRINAGRGAEEASQLIGDQEIEREERSDTMAGGRSSVTTSRRRDIRRVITADEIATRLGPRDRGLNTFMETLRLSMRSLRSASAAAGADYCTRPMCGTAMSTTTLASPKLSPRRGMPVRSYRSPISNRSTARRHTPCRARLRCLRERGARDLTSPATSFRMTGATPPSSPPCPFGRARAA
jgi:Type IV secretion-system coupling protein DNA-binding domain